MNWRSSTESPNVRNCVSKKALFATETIWNICFAIFQARRQSQMMQNETFPIQFNSISFWRIWWRLGLHKLTHCKSLWKIFRIECLRYLVQNNSNKNVLVNYLVALVQFHCWKTWYLRKKTWKTSQKFTMNTCCRILTFGLILNLVTVLTFFQIMRNRDWFI